MGNERAKKDPRWEEPNEVELACAWATLGAGAFCSAVTQLISWSMAVVVAFWPLILIALVLAARLINLMGSGHDD